MVIFNDKVYEYLKFVALVVLPATATLYFALAGIWDIPAAKQVVGTIVVIDTFLGSVLQISNIQYRKEIQAGTIVVDETDDKMMFSLELEGNPEDLKHQENVMFKVKKSG